MRKAVILGAFAVAFFVAAGKPAQAEYIYPWCAYQDASTYNCGFSNFYQCRATVSGIGGHCVRNPRFYYHAAEPHGYVYGGAAYRGYRFY